MFHQWFRGNLIPMMFVIMCIVIIIVSTVCHFCKIMLNLAPDSNGFIIYSTVYYLVIFFQMCLALIN